MTWEIVMENKGLIHRIVNRIWHAGPAAQAWGSKEDLEEEGYLIALKALRTFDPAKGRISTYLYMVVRQKLLGLVLHGGLVRSPVNSHGDDRYSEDWERTRVIYSGRHRGADEEPLDLLLIAREEREGEGLEDLVDRLPPRLRQLVRQHHWQHLSIGEVAANQGLSRQRVCVMMADAYARLREKLKDRDDERRL